jgi:hypothetical protein
MCPGVQAAPWHSTTLLPLAIYQLACSVDVHSMRAATCCSTYCLHRSSNAPCPGHHNSHGQAIHTSPRPSAHQLPFPTTTPPTTTARSCTPSPRCHLAGDTHYHLPPHTSLPPHCHLAHRSSSGAWRWRRSCGAGSCAGCPARGSPPRWTFPWRSVTCRTWRAPRCRRSSCAP